MLQPTLPTVRKHTLLGLLALALCLTLFATGPALFAAHVQAGGAAPVVPARSQPAPLPHACSLIHATPHASCTPR